MRELPSQRILIVDDDEPVREATTRMILKMGYPCDAVSSGEEALEELQREHFDIVVLDIAMEGMNGLEFMKRAKERFPGLYFIMMTGYTSEYSYTDIIKAGAIDYMAKPFERAELEARLERAIKERRLLCQLKESETRYRALFQGAAEGIIAADIETKELKYVNPAICTMLGYTEEELERMSVGDIHPKEALEHVISEFEAQARGEKTLAPCIPCLRKDGTTIYADINTAKVSIGGVECNVGFFTDTTNRKREEEVLKKSHDELERTLSELKETQEYMSAVFQGSGDGMRVIDKDFNILRVNMEMERLTGVSAKESVGQKCYEHFPGEFCHTDNCSLRRLLTGEERIKTEPVKVANDGRRISVELVSTSLKTEGEVVAINQSFRDITQRKKTEEALKKAHDELEQTLSRLKETQAQMLQSEKMASIGQLAAGVAHEINNPTGFVSSNLKTLSDYQNDIITVIKQYRSLAADLKETMPTAGYPTAISEQVERILALETEVDIDFILNDAPNLVQESREGTERIKKIVLDLKDFAHPGEDKPQFADINKGLDSTLNVVWNELKYKTTVTKEYGDLPEVRCYPQQLNQVFVNLLVNAAQAIEKQGEVKITTGALDGKVEIKISDTGKGIPKENLSKIFDPFFTTKEVGKGTGLGLNVAYNIIQKHKGTIDVESTVGVGTTFKIRIPVDGH